MTLAVGLNASGRVTLPCGSSYSPSKNHAHHHVKTRPLCRIDIIASELNLTFFLEN